MRQPEDPQALFVPFFESLDAVGFGEHNDPHHFDTGTLFWSLTRLFGCYERIMSVVHLPRDDRPFLEADLENFIIRFRIVANDIAYVIRQLLPTQARGLKGPKGQTHTKNREMSVFLLAKHLTENAAAYPELSAAFADAVPWLTRLKNDRDNVIHYKSKVVIFESEVPTFALLDAAGTWHPEPSPGGPRLRWVKQPVITFVNEQMLLLHRFMHESLAVAVKDQATRSGLKMVQVGWDQRMSCPGVQRFRESNKTEL